MWEEPLRPDSCVALDRVGDDQFDEVVLRLQVIF